MRAVHTPPDVAAVDAELRQLTPGVERLLRARFGIGTSASRRRAAESTIPRRRLRQLEASAFRRLRLNAITPRAG